MSKNRFIFSLLLFLIMALCVTFAVSASDSTAVGFPELQITEITDIVPSYDGGTDSGQHLPVSYSAVGEGLVTPAKSQVFDGPCWAFSAISMAETSLIKNGVTVNGEVATPSNIDLSEAHLVYFFTHPALDPLKNLMGDTVEMNDPDTWITSGGNHMHAMLAFAAWRGAADESLISYDEMDTDSVYDSSLSWEDVAHMQNAYCLSMENSDGVKQMILDYGSVVTSYCHDEDNVGYNDKTHAFYSGSDVLTSNHAITIVGWNDNYSVSNFDSSLRPKSKGAWLIKNSWGDRWGDNGYFWMSYEDATLRNEQAFVFDFESADNYDNNYQYDGTGSTVYIGMPPVYETACYSNVFTVDASETESLRAVSFAMYSTDVDYSVQIYKNPGSTPTSGTAMLDEPVCGTTTYTGYYTVPLNEEVILSKGDSYSIVLSLDNSEGAQIYVDCTSSQEWLRFTNEVHDGESYFGLEYDAGGGSTAYAWQSLYTQMVTPRIKGFTDSVVSVCERIDGVSAESGEGYNRLNHPCTVKLVSDSSSPLPEEIRVTLGGVKTEDFTYDRENGTVEIGNLTGEAVITAVVDCRHTWDGGRVVVIPTKAHDGVVVYTCTKCGDVKTGVAPFLFGDVNSDLLINGKDGNIMSTYINGDLAEIDMEKADINEDNLVNGKDANLHMQIVNGDYDPNTH